MGALGHRARYSAKPYGRADGHDIIYIRRMVRQIEYGVYRDLNMILVNSIFYLLKGDYNWLQWVGDNLCNYILIQGCEKYLFPTSWSVGLVSLRRCPTRRFGFRLWV